MKTTYKKIFATLLIFNLSIAIAGEGLLPTPNYKGDFLDRSTLTGNWNGLRHNLAEVGLYADFKVVTTYQNMFEGGIDDEDGFVSTQNLLLQLDTGKANLWPGGLLKFRVESRIGGGLQETGAFSPANANALFPNDANNVNDNAIGITEFSYTQFLSPQFGIFGGLLNTTSGDANELAGSSSSSAHFLNTSFLVSMGEFRTAPSTSLGAGLIFIPTDWLTGTLTYVDTEESASRNPFTTEKGTTLATEWIAKYQLSDLPGAQTFGLLYGFDNDFVEFNQDPRISIPRLVRGDGVERDGSSWAFYHNAHQYLQWEDGRGWGVFSRFGIADRQTNPVDWSAAVGISGKGIFDARPNDSFGIGYYHLELTDTPLFSFLDLNDENGAELWYNAEITPWFHVTADIQVVDTALGQAGRGIIPPGFLSVSLPESKTAWIFGLRTELKF